MAWTRTRLEVPAIAGDPPVLLATPPPDGGWTPRLDRTVTRGQVFRLINPGVTTSGAVEWGGNLRVLPLGNRRFCFRYKSMSLGKSRQSRPLLHQRIGFRRRRIYSRGGNLRRGTISIFLTTPSPVRHRFRSGAIRALLPSTMLAMTTLLHAPTITLMRSSLEPGESIEHAINQALCSHLVQRARVNEVKDFLVGRPFV